MGLTRWRGKSKSVQERSANSHPHDLRGLGLLPRMIRASFSGSLKTGMLILGDTAWRRCGTLMHNALMLRVFKVYSLFFKAKAGACEEELET